MPTIYDNIETNLLDGLKDALQVAVRGDFCVGYFNLRGWKSIAAQIDQLQGENGIAPCRLIVGMTTHEKQAVRDHYHGANTEVTNKVVNAAKKEHAQSLRKQLTYGIPTAADQAGLKKLAKQLRAGKLLVKFFGAHRLHAKLYLAHRNDNINPIIGYVGSSNLTLAGLEKQGELNVDVLDKDAARKLADWFEQRWNDRWCLDISQELAEIIEESWANGPINPFEIYIKTAYELSKEAIEGASGFKVPREFNKVMLEFQKQAVSLAAERLSRHGGVIIGDVVGLGKTLVASAVAKTFQEDRGDNVLVICPPKLQEMWEGYIHKYKIAGKTLSLGAVGKLKNMRRYRLVVIDESHNLRNRDSKRYGQVHDYLHENESRVILLTATPYNKHFTDIGNQLRLFVEADADLGARPEEYIQHLGSADEFKKAHPTALITSLAAFEHSEKVDDWRELMRMYMVRRTRNHIKKNYAEFDEERQQHYLTFSDETKFYFPHRQPKCAKFSLSKGDKTDQYALLYSKPVVEIINKLNLPRYGLGQYLVDEYQDDSLPDELTEEEKTIIKNLSRAGQRLIGFAKAGLFKRLESSGPSFLLSIKRHIIRNAIYLSALEQDKAFPIGDIFSTLVDESVEEDDNEANNLFADRQDDNNEIENYLAAGANIYNTLSSPNEKYHKKFDWIDASFFEPSLKDDLLADCHSLLKILASVPKWNADTDRKLDTLAKLCNDTHNNEKLLIFTQFKDTAEYLHEELAKRGTRQLAVVFGGIDNIPNYVKRFSPTSNDAVAGEVDELRVLITTDTLSEGQNLQDAHIIVNFDLPWALIRLVQRAGRVDRIGQKAREIICYCFLPEEGIERIIDLRTRLQDRIQESADLIGSDEKFFDGDQINLQQIYAEQLDLEEQDDETDLISRAYDIWRQATKDDPALKARIENLPDVVYSAKKINTKKIDGELGAIAYIKTNNNQHILAQVSEAEKVISQSQSKILNLLACEPSEPLATPAQNHHQLVAAAVGHVKEGQADIGGQLGTIRSIRNRVYSRLNLCLEELKGTLFDSENLKQAVQQIYQHPLKETARDKLGRQLRAHIGDDELVQMVLRMYNENDLSAMPKPGESIETHIICSMGLIK